VALAWSVAAFGEEMVYRGYLMDRVADLLNRTRHAWIISLIAVQVGFGLAHAYQGVTGVIDEGLMGLLLRLIYLGTGRNLAVSIVAHGIADTTDFDLFRQISRHVGPASDQCCLVGAQNKRRSHPKVSHFGSRRGQPRLYTLDRSAVLLGTSFKPSACRMRWI
jgi:membrane protease YdiL (CAAX protease family)